MASYYGTIQGNRGVASRVGSSKSGIRAMVKSWNNEANISLTDNNGEDELTITADNKLQTRINGITAKTRSEIKDLLMDFKTNLENGNIETEDEIEEFVNDRW